MHSQCGHHLTYNLSWMFTNHIAWSPRKFKTVENYPWKTYIFKSTYITGYRVLLPFLPLPSWHQFLNKWYSLQLWSPCGIAKEPSVAYCRISQNAVGHPNIDIEDSDTLLILHTTFRVLHSKVLNFGCTYWFDHLLTVLSFCSVILRLPFLKYISLFRPTNI